jgi:zinc transporter 1/2/3
MAEELSNETLECVTTYEEGDYNLSLRIASIFILLFTSFIGVATPTLVKGRGWKVVDQILMIGKFFGAGVITATGFIHIFPEAVEVLSDPCLPEFFQLYGASAGLFALIAVLFTHLMEYLAQNINFKKKKSEGGHDHDQETEMEESSHGHQHEHHNLIDMDDKNRVAVYILEAGIAIHSVIIGVDLGLALEEFQSLLIALVFHQFFEGIGLGYRLAELDVKSKLKPLLNSFLYSITTPVGVAIGIGSYIGTSNQDYVAATAAKGIVDAMAGGILIYVALVGLLADQFQQESFKKLSIPYKIMYFIATYVGAALMAMIGIWA